MRSLTLSALEEHVSTLGPHAQSFQIAPERELAIVAPAFVIGDLPAELSYALFGEIAVGPVRCYRLEKAMIANAGVICTGDALLWSTLTNHPKAFVGGMLDGVAAALDSLPRRTVNGPAVMFSGPGSNIYGHALVDILPRLYVLQCAGFNLEDLRFILSAIAPRVVYDVMAYCGINEEQIVVHDESAEILDVDDLIVASNLRRGSRFHPLMGDAVRFLRRHIAAALPADAAPSSKQVFVSRVHADTSRMLRNRAEIEAIASDEGLQIVLPETMSFIEQVALFQRSELIVGEYGSGLHNSMFMYTGGVVMAIRGSSHHPGFIQSSLGGCLGHLTGYILCQTPIHDVHQSFTAETHAFRLGLRCARLLAPHHDYLG